MGKGDSWTPSVERIALVAFPAFLFQNILAPSMVNPVLPPNNSHSLPPMSMSNLHSWM